jgi:1,5-anhydro-D-fructose reductase (1,5-anhydro-D-mannitol-forming)
MINCGIIGYGKMGMTRERALLETGRGKVVATYDTVKGSPPEGARWADRPEDIINDPEVDAVFICTPNYRNKPLTIAALEAGKHVFCEKPPAFTAPEVREIQAAEEKSGRSLMYGFNHRHHSSIRQMKKIVESGGLGKVLWMRGRYGKEVDEAFFTGWRADKKLAGGGIMLDQGIHMLDLFVYLGGNFDEVQAMVSNLFWKMDGIEDNVFVNLRSKDTGVCASLHSTMTQWRHIFSLEVFLEKGALILNGLKTSSGAYGDEELTVKTNADEHAGNFASEEKLVYHEDESWRSEVDHFFDAIKEGRKPLLGSSNDALVVMTLMDRIYGNEFSQE